MMQQLPIHTHPAFSPPQVEQLMPQVGWVRQQAYNAYYCHMVWQQAYSAQPAILRNLQKCFAGSPTDMYRRFATSIPFNTSQVPTPGSIVIWQYGTGWMGRAGIVERTAGPRSFISIEMNTPTGQSNDLRIQRHTRRISTTHQPYGYNLMGFIPPPPIPQQ